MYKLALWLLLAAPLLSPSAGWSQETSAPEPKVASPECTESFAVCIERKRAELALRGTVGMKVHSPHQVSAEIDDDAEDHPADLWFVMLLAPNGPASKSGLRVGDRILKWNDRSMPADTTVFEGWLGEARAGQVIKIEVERGGDTLTFTLKAVAPEEWLLDAWMVDYVRENYSPGIYEAYRARVLSERPESP